MARTTRWASPGSPRRRSRRVLAGSRVGAANRGKPRPDISLAISKAMALSSATSRTDYKTAHPRQTQETSRPLSRVAQLSDGPEPRLVDRLRGASRALAIRRRCAAAATVPATIARCVFGAGVQPAPRVRRIAQVMYLRPSSPTVSAKEVKLFGLGRSRLGRYRDLGETFYRRHALAVRRPVGLCARLRRPAFYACYAAMAVAAARAHCQTGMTLAMSRSAGAASFRSLLGAFRGMRRRLSSISFVPGLRQRSKINGSVAASQVNGHSAAALETRWIIQGVGFRYPGARIGRLQHRRRHPRRRSLALVSQNSERGHVHQTPHPSLPPRPRAYPARRQGSGRLGRRPSAPPSASPFQDFAQYQLTARERGLGAWISSKDL